MPGWRRLASMQLTVEKRAVVTTASIWTMRPMGARAESAATIAPLLAAVEESGVVAAGSGAMEEVFMSMEQGLEAVLDGAEKEVRHIDRHAEERTFALATDSRRQITMLRAALVEQASTLAYTYESMLALLDDAERTLEGITDAARTR